MDCELFLQGAFVFPVEDSREKSPSSEQKAQEAKDEYRFVVEETVRIRAQVVEPYFGMSQRNSNRC